MRIRRSEEDGHRPAFRSSEEVSAVDPGVIHDSPNVVNPLINTLHLAAPIGRARPALVEVEESGERGEPIEHAPHLGPLPRHLYVLRCRRYGDHLDRSVAKHLIGKPGAASRGELDGRDICHDGSGSSRS